MERTRPSLRPPTHKDREHVAQRVAQLVQRHEEVTGKKARPDDIAQIGVTVWRARGARI